MRFGINETGGEQLENQQISEQSSELESKEREITDGERERLSEAAPNVEERLESSGDGSNKLSQDGPKLGESKRETENTSAANFAERDVCENSERDGENRADTAERAGEERENSGPLDLSGPRFEVENGDCEDYGDHPEVAENTVNIHDEAESKTLDKEELRSRWNNAVEGTLAAKEDDYRDKGLSEEEIASRLAEDRRTEENELGEDILPTGEQENLDRPQNIEDDIMQAGDDEFREKKMDAVETEQDRSNDTEKYIDNGEQPLQSQIAEKNAVGYGETHEANHSERAPSLSEALNDPELFTVHKPMDYTYAEGSNGKQAYGQLGISDAPVRNPKAQREAGGEERRDDDDGGHLLAARHGGSPDSENVDAQNSNLNRGPYKRQENGWTEALKNGDKVYANIETYKRDGKERPDAYMGWTVTEHPNGTREWDAFSFTNESNEEQAKWAAELEELPDTPDIPNAMVDDDYDRIHRLLDEEDGE